MTDSDIKEAALHVGAIVGVAACGFIAGMTVTSQQWGSAGNWVKAIAGPFIGAGLAFMANRYTDHLKRDREDLSAGNLALFTLGTWLSDFYQIRRAVHEVATRRLAPGPAPDWALAPRLHATFADGSLIDFSGLAFLLGSPAGRDAFTALRQAEIGWRDFCSIVSKNADSVLELQKASATLQRQHADPSWEEAAAYLGRELTSRVTQEFQSLLVRLRTDEGLLLKAHRLLFAAVQERFGSGAWPKNIEPEAGFSLQEIPALPAQLQQLAQRQQAR